MKKLSKFVLGAIAIGVLSFNLTLNDGKSIANTSLKNISVMMASADNEIYCDQSDQTSCKIVIIVDGQRIEGYSTGTTRGEYWPE